MLYRPEATLAPNMPPYNEEIIDGETGLLFATGPTPQQSIESFAANLAALIERADLRAKLGENAKKWVLENRHYFKTSRGLYDYYMELRARKMVEKPYDPEKDKLPPKPVPVVKPTPRAPKKRGSIRKKK
jgi:hypothetical protein